MPYEKSYEYNYNAHIKLHRCNSKNSYTFTLLGQYLEMMKSTSTKCFCVRQKIELLLCFNRSVKCIKINQLEFAMSINELRSYTSMSIAQSLE